MRKNMGCLAMGSLKVDTSCAFIPLTEANNLGMAFEHARICWLSHTQYVHTN
jgi:hypothetical protein